MPEDESMRVAHLLLANIAIADLLKMEVLDREVIDRDEIVRLADTIEQHTMQLAQMVLGANIDEWKAELEGKRNKE